MKRIMLYMMLMVFLLSSATLAHVANEKTLYDDIQFSEAKEEIVYLRGLDAIAYEHGAQLFKPNEKLTRADLAFWAATFHHLGEHDTAKEQLQQAALDEDLIETLDGDATYTDVNQAYFDGKAPAEKASQTLTKEEFALYMGQFFQQPVDGQTLFDMAGYKPGPAGTVEAVDSKTVGEGEAAYDVFHFTINGKQYTISSHPKVLYGPVDLSSWEDKVVVESWLAPGEGDRQAVQIAKAQTGQFIGEDTQNQSEPMIEQDKDNTEPAPQAETDQEAQSFPIVPAVGAAVLFGVIGWLLANRKK